MVSRFCHRPVPHTSPRVVTSAFNAYSKVQLGCGGRRTVLAALVSTVGADLSKAAGTQSAQQHLFALAANTGATGARSDHAVCVYTTPALDNELDLGGTDPKQEGTSGWALPSNTKPTDTCAASSTTKLTPRNGVGRPLTLGDASVLYTNSITSSTTFTALAVDVVHGHTVVILGADTGAISTVVAKSFIGTGATPTSTAVGKAGGGAVKQLTVFAKSNTVLVLTHNGVHALPLAQCAQHTDCASCTVTFPPGDHLSIIHCERCSN